ncbi:MAG: hypothetical protein ACRDJY_06765 [Thermoleophilaceae bacterium]
MLDALKRVLPEEQRRWLRSTARGNPYRIVPGREPVRIGDVVSPLRYDVMIRVRHFALHAERRELFRSDFDAYERLVRSEPYFVWFEKARVPTWWPWLLDDPEGFERAWRERLRLSAALFDSFEASGFDTAHPIELHAGRRVQETPTGKRTARALYSGDGNHRLALLLAAGHEQLHPAQYRVKRYRSLVPTDSTGFLLRETGAGWSEYRPFLELGYPSATAAMEGGRVRVEASDASVQAEVAKLVELDLPHLTGLER